MGSSPSGDNEVSVTYRCRRRPPLADISLKRMAAELSVAEYSLTGIDTNPNASESDAMEREGIVQLRTALRFLASP